MKNGVYLPHEFTDDFEKRFLRYRDSETEIGRRKITRSHIIWRATQKMIVYLKIDPMEWFERRFDIYDYFFKNHIVSLMLEKFYLLQICGDTSFVKNWENHFFQ